MILLIWSVAIFAVITYIIMITRNDSKTKNITLGITTTKNCVITPLPQNYATPACWRDPANWPISNSKRHFM